MPDRPLWHLAAAFSAHAHRSQFRKDGRTPYAAHPARVAMIVVREFGIDDDHALAAAYLHDTIEDCDVDYDDLHALFGRRVADLVAALTKDMRCAEAEREPAYDAQLARASWEARAIKLADVWDNLTDAATPTEQRKFLEKGDRALALVVRDARLADAASRLRSFMDSVLAEMDGRSDG